MGKVYDAIDERPADFIERQHLFFVGTAPTDMGGRLNISPKGLDTLRILGPRRVAYLDLTGSGVETIAHLRDNGRMTLMFCAFEGAPLIVRLHGKGSVVEPSDAEWTGLSALLPDIPGARAIITMDVERVSGSCGFAVPLFEYRGERDLLVEFARKRGPKGLAEYRHQKNSRSIDGLDGLTPAGSPNG